MQLKLMKRIAEKDINQLIYLKKIDMDTQNAILDKAAEWH
jgi:hypothetical protein